VACPALWWSLVPARRCGRRRENATGHEQCDTLIAWYLQPAQQLAYWELKFLQCDTVPSILSAFLEGRLRDCDVSRVDNQDVRIITMRDWAHRRFVIVVPVCYADESYATRRSTVHVKTLSSFRIGPPRVCRGGSMFFLSRSHSIRSKTRSRRTYTNHLRGAVRHCAVSEHYTAALEARFLLSPHGPIKIAPLFQSGSPRFPYPV
jgi:hypothetical protein